MAFENPRFNHAQLRALAELLWESGITRLQHTFDVAEDANVEGTISVEYYDNFGHCTSANISRKNEG